MMTRDGGRNREQVEFTSLDELVPEGHLVRKLENAIDWSFIYEMVEEIENGEATSKGLKDGQGKLNPNTSKKKRTRQKKEKHRKKSTSNPESGWFRKGEHKNVFAYSVQTACDINGIVLGYSVHPGNENDGRTFPTIFEKIQHLNIEVVVGDSA